MSYPMWNPDKNGILVKAENGDLEFVENGPEFDALKEMAADWHDIPDPEPTPAELLAQAKTARAAAYANEADPLFFKWQRGEVAEQEWLDKVAEIRTRYPYKEE